MRSGRKGLCELHQPTGSGRELGRYLAIIENEQLPRVCRRDDRLVYRGYAVNIGQWFFFHDEQSALAFGRTAYKSIECRRYNVREAAYELKHCPIHQVDERVLWVGHDVSTATGPRLG